MSDRPVLAIVANAPSPYRIHQHARIARELPQVELRSVFIHEKNIVAWSNALPAEIRAEIVRPGESMMEKNTPRNFARQWAIGGEVIHRLRAMGARAVIVTGYNDLGLMRIIRWCRRHRVPCYMFSDSNVHGDRATGAARFFKNIYVRWVVRTLAGLMPCGTLGSRFYDRYGGRGKPTFFMPHEPDYGVIFDVTAGQIAEVKRRFGLRDDRGYVMYSGRLAPVKRVDTLIDAFTRIAPDRPGWDLLIVGGGPLEAELKARVPGEVDDRVVWAGFVDDRLTLSALYRAADVFVLPSSYEPWAVVVAEAAAAGLAIICSGVVGAGAELVRDNNGRLFPPGDAAALAARLLEVTEPGVTEQLKAGSRDVLRDWRLRGDPVDGVRKALVHAGVLPESARLVNLPPHHPLGAAG